MYRSLTVALAAALMAPMSQAMAEVKLESRCEVESQYDLTVERDRLLFSREAGSEVAIANGRVFLDGNAVVLSTADAARVAEFERDVRALVPEVKAIAGEAIEIAFTALNRVIATFASDSNQAAFIAELDAMRAEISAAVASAQSTRSMDDEIFEAKVKGFVSRLAPRLAGEFASLAVTAALSGDEKAAAEIERKADRLAKEIEASVEAPAKLLEARANALCPRIEALDRIESELDVRLPNGDKLELLEVVAKA